MYREFIRETARLLATTNTVIPLHNDLSDEPSSSETLQKVEDLSKIVDAYLWLRFLIN